MRITLEKQGENVWYVIGENGYMSCKIEKDSYNTWFVPTQTFSASFSADELEAIIKAMRNI